MQIGVTGVCVCVNVNGKSVGLVDSAANRVIPKNTLDFLTLQNKK